MILQTGNETASDEGRGLSEIRPMLEEDIEAIFDIELRAYEFPWTKGIFRECFRAGYPAWVMLRADRLVGYGILSAAAGEAHILNICIDPDYQGQGNGRTLLGKLLEQAALLNTSRVFLEVRRSNQRALAIYRAAGFEEIGLRQRYYRDHNGREDAIVLAKDLLGR